MQALSNCIQSERITSNSSNNWTQGSNYWITLTQKFRSRTTFKCQQRGLIIGKLQSSWYWIPLSGQLAQLTQFAKDNKLQGAMKVWKSVPYLRLEIGRYIENLWICSSSRWNRWAAGSIEVRRGHPGVRRDSSWEDLCEKTKSKKDNKIREKKTKRREKRLLLERIYTTLSAHILQICFLTCQTSPVSQGSRGV